MSNVKLIVAGSGDAFGSGGRLSTCFYIETPATRFLIDCGASSIPGLKRNNIDQDSIDTILISHFHGDHFGGLPFFLLEAAVWGRQKPITIISPPGCKDRVEKLLGLLYPGSTVLEKLTVHFIEYRPLETIDTGHLSVQAYPVIHSEAALSHGLRINVAGRIISYSGDTEWTENLVGLSANADLFICECNFFGLHVKGHLNYQTLKPKLPELNCQRIVLTHPDTEMLDNLDRVDLECLEDGRVLEI